MFKFKPLYAVLGLSLVLFHCNLYESFASKNEVDYDNFIHKGNEAFQNGDYAKAVGYYKNAKGIDHRRSEAFVFEAKAILNQYGLTYTKLKTEFDAKVVDGESGIPFVYDETGIKSIDSVAFPINYAVHNLEYIIRTDDGDTASTGMFSVEEITLDAGLLQGLQSMLAPLDLDGNMRVDSTCGLSLDSLTASQKCKKGLLSEVKRLETFKSLTTKLDLNELSSDSVDAKDISNDPNDINDFISSVVGPARKSDSNLSAVNDAMGQYAKDSTLREELDDIMSSINELNEFLSYMYYNDGLDNDFECVGVSSPEKMLWHDYDGDRRIRYDYDENWDSLVAADDGVLAAHSLFGNIGHPMHRYKNRGLYEPMVVYQLQNEQTSSMEENSRSVNMINKCQDVADDIPNTLITDGLKAYLRDSTCTQFSSALKASVTPPVRSDWISGCGVDEEILDQIDNDYDGIQDEDSRSALGYDDDNDGAIDTSMIGQVISPMIWTDVNGNGCIDIDTTIALNTSNPKQNCIGAFQHRIYLATLDSDSSNLKSMYLKYVDQSDIDECVNDVDRIIEDMTDQNLIDLFNAQKSKACAYSHEWKGGMPVNSEWSAGVFGVDEEILDGIDNDGDGWVDEDIGFGN